MTEFYTVMLGLKVVAHPDEALGFGGTFKKYADEGVETCLITANRGEYGWFGSAENILMKQL